MKDRSLLGAIAVVGSWAGNIILTVLAVYLAVSHSATLTPLTFLTVALCILLGNALPLSAYLLHIWWYKITLEAEQKEATLTLRDALSRTESVSERLQEVHDTSAKAVLVGRQIPDRIQEKMVKLEEAIDFLSEDSNSDLFDSIKKLQIRLENIETHLGSQNGNEDTAYLESVKRLESKLATLQETLSELNQQVHSLKEAAPAAPEASAFTSPFTPMEDSPDWTVEESEATEAEEWAEDQLEDAVSEPIEPEPASKEPDVETEDGEPAPQTEVSEQSDEPEQSEEPEKSDEPKKPNAKKSSQKGNTKKAAKQPTQPDPQGQLIELEEQDGGTVLKDDQVELRVHVMIGISNRLYLRGDGPGLSWEEGIPLELVGIGEYQWEASGIDGPVQCQLYLNDQTPAGEEPQTLEPGHRHDVRPVFPR